MCVGEKEVRRRIAQQNVSVFDCTAKSEAELELWTPGHNKLDARKSFDHSDKHGATCRETCRGKIDFRIQGLHHSAGQEHDHIRKQAVQKLIHQFENHPNKEALQADTQQNSAFNPFSEHSKDMMYSMGSMEYFEICEITPNIPCPNCMTYWPKGVVYCTGETCLRPSDKVRKT